METNRACPGVRGSFHIWLASAGDWAFFVWLYGLASLGFTAWFVLKLKTDSTDDENGTDIIGLVAMGVCDTLFFLSLLASRVRKEVLHLCELAANLLSTFLHYAGHCLLPRGWSLRFPRYRGHLRCRPGCMTGLRSCGTCYKMCARSALLRGRPWLFVPSTERHVFQSWNRLCKSKSRCDLCRLFYFCVPETRNHTGADARADLVHPATDMKVAASKFLTPFFTCTTSLTHL